MPAPRTVFTKSVEVRYVEEEDMWVGWIYQPAEWEKSTDQEPAIPIDVFAALHETSLLSRIHEVYDNIIIEETDGEIKLFR